MPTRSGVYSDEDMMKIFWPLYFTGVIDPPIGSDVWKMCEVYLQRFKDNWQPLLQDMEDDLQSIVNFPIDIAQLIELEQSDEFVSILRQNAIATLNEIGLAPPNHASKKIKSGLPLNFIHVSSGKCLSWVLEKDGIAVSVKEFALYREFKTSNPSFIL